MPAREGEAGQSVIELSLILPLLLMLLLGILEFGMAFDHLITITYASREGARTGSALVNGGGVLGCSSGQSPNAALVDPQIIAAVERVLTSPGSQVRLDQVSEIRIFLATSSCGETTSVNVWRYGLDQGPTVDGDVLDFKAITTPWNACSRTNTLPAPSIGVTLKYRYAFQTPISGLFRIVGGTSSTGIDMTDRAVMAMNPTQ